MTPERWQRVKEILQGALDRDAGDSPQFKPLVETTAENFTIKEVPADKAYLSRENLELAAKHDAVAYIPFKNRTNGIGKRFDELWNKAWAFHMYNREAFLEHYHKRSNVETTFSMIKAKFGDHLRSKTDTAMVNEALCKILCHNICCLIQSHYELGIEATSWGVEPAAPMALPSPVAETDPVEAWAWV